MTNNQKLTSGSRNLKVRVNTAKGRKISSTRWLQRQLNDPYVSQAKLDGYRSRAAYKLLEIDQKFKIFQPGQIVIDLGSAPGGWSQVSAAKIFTNRAKGKVFALDLQEMQTIDNVIFLQKNFNDITVDDIKAWTDSCKVDVVLSDMAGSSTWHQATDHLVIMDLCDNAFEFAKLYLKDGGAFIVKILRGGAEKELLDKLKFHFKKLKHFKPTSSRADSSEIFLVCQNFQNKNESL